jgi:AraC family ethanolamine operon transcriptional activator
MAQRLQNLAVASSNPSIPVHAPRASLPAGAWSEARFVDIDEQAAALDGWNQQYLQLSAGVFRGAVQRLQLDGVGLFIEDLQQVVHQTGHVRPQVVALGVPVLLQGDSRFCGQADNTSALHVFSGSEGFEFRSPQRHIMLGIEVDAALFESHMNDTLQGEATSFASHARLHVGDAAAIAELRSFLLALFAGAAQQSTLLQPEGQRLDVRDQLLDRLAAVLAPASDPPDPACVQREGMAVGAARNALAERARQLVASRLDQPPTVAELCQLLGVSRRTLQTCFQATWGMGPLAWLKTLRLNVVRRRLMTADSVTEAATQLGFWHFGHFADDYRTLFGELPSQTLRRHQGSRTKHTSACS